MPHDALGIVDAAVDHLIVRVVPNRHWTGESAGGIARCIQDFFEAPIRVEVEVVERLTLTAAGKLRDVIIEIEPDPGAP